MKYCYQRYPDDCRYNSISYYHQDICEKEGLTERLTEDMPNCLEIGDLAPDFSLEGVFEGDRVRINLYDQRGRWTVLFFYPSDFTFV